MSEAEPTPKRHKKCSRIYVTIYCNLYDQVKTYRVSDELLEAVHGDWHSQVVEVKDPKVIRILTAMYATEVFEEDSETLSPDEEAEKALATTAEKVDTVPLDEPHYLLFWDI